MAATTTRIRAAPWRSLRVLTVLCALLTLSLESATATPANELAVEEFQQRYNTDVVDHGCHTCRTGNCSHAVENKFPGVYCGDLVITFQPCCCAYRNECMTTIFSESCECFNSAEEEELMTTRFYLFVVLTLLAWVLLIYDKMCGGPYKVANSSHVLLATTPSAAQSMAGSESEDEPDESPSPSQQQQRERGDVDDDNTDSAQVELTVLSSPRAMNSATAHSDSSPASSSSTTGAAGSQNALVAASTTSDSTQSV